MRCLFNYGEDTVLSKIFYLQYFDITMDIIIRQVKNRERTIGFKERETIEMKRRTMRGIQSRNDKKKNILSKETQKGLALPHTNNLYSFDEKLGSIGLSSHRRQSPH